jgi:hypothetical protein
MKEQASSRAGQINTAAEGMRTKHRHVSHAEVYANERNERETPTVYPGCQVKMKIPSFFTRSSV